MLQVEADMICGSCFYPLPLPRVSVDAARNHWTPQDAEENWSSILTIPFVKEGSSTKVEDGVKGVQASNVRNH